MSTKKAKMTVKEAIEKGKKQVNTPVQFIIIGVWIICFGWNMFNSFSLWLLPTILFGAPLLGWLYWSFAITKWRILAFSNVDDICELEREAIANQLIWERGSIFEKTEIRTGKEIVIIEGYKKELEKCAELMYSDDFDFNEDDLPVPNYLDDIFQLNSDSNNSEFYVEGELKCTCGSENFAIHYVGDDSKYKKEKVIKVAQIKDNYFLIVKARCQKCQKEHLIFDNDYHGWNGLFVYNENRNIERPPIKEWYCRKCDNPNHKIGLVIYSNGKKDFILETENEYNEEMWKDAFSSITIKTECINCSEINPQWIEYETM